MSGSTGDPSENEDLIAFVQKEARRYAPFSVEDREDFEQEAWSEIVACGDSGDLVSYKKAAHRAIRRAAYKEYGGQHGYVGHRQRNQTLASSCGIGLPGEIPSEKCCSPLIQSNSRTRSEWQDEDEEERRSLLTKWRAMPDRERDSLCEKERDRYAAMFGASR